MALDEKDSVVLVGVIPRGKVGVEIVMQADTDLDVVIYDAEDTVVYSQGRAVVAWCSRLTDPLCNFGTLSATTPETKGYKGMEVTYSGYEGIEGQPGFESVFLAGTTTTTLRVGAFAYEVGSAKVTYTWKGDATPCCLGTAACGGNFTAPIGLRETVLIGDIPPGKLNLVVNLESSEDLDIQLFDLGDTQEYAEGAAVVAYTLCVEGASGCNFGVMGDSPSLQTAEYKGLLYTYSGFNGISGVRGREFISIRGTTNTPLRMKAYGYVAGGAEVTYSYWEPVS